MRCRRTRIIILVTRCARFVSASWFTTLLSVKADMATAAEQVAVTDMKSIPLDDQSTELAVSSRGRSCTGYCGEERRADGR